MQVRKWPKFSLSIPHVQQEVRDCKAINQLIQK